MPVITVKCYKDQMADKFLRLNIFAVAVAALLAAAQTGPATAAEFMRTRQPMAMVGTLDPVLSVACQHLVFNQRRVQDLHIGFAGKQGRGITGIAKKGYNLKDPRGLARNGTTYHFFNDGYSDCRVYTARLP